MRLKFLCAGYLIQHISAQNWKHQENKNFWGKCGILNNFQDLQEANYNVVYGYDQRSGQHVATVYPQACQDDRNRDSDKYMFQQNKKNKKRQEAEDKQRKKALAKAKNAEKRAKKLAAKEKREAAAAKKKHEAATKKEAAEIRVQENETKKKEKKAKQAQIAENQKAKKEQQAKNKAKRAKIEKAKAEKEAARQEKYVDGMEKNLQVSDGDSKYIPSIGEEFSASDAILNASSDEEAASIENLLYSDVQQTTIDLANMDFAGLNIGGFTSRKRRETEDDSENDSEDQGNDPESVEQRVFGDLDFYTEDDTPVQAGRSLKQKGWDTVKHKKTGYYACGEYGWYEKRPVRDICTDDFAPENEEYKEEVNANHVEGDESCPRNHIWDADSQSFIRNPCASNGDINAWLTEDDEGNRGCLNARSLIYTDEGSDNYKFRAEGAKIKGIPCGASIKYLLELEASDYSDYNVLQYINLARNKLVHIPCSLFWRIGTQQLFLNQNNLEKICPNMIDLMNRQYNSEHLRSIFLHQNNLIAEDLSPEFFTYTNVTDYFRIDDNELRTVDKAWFDSMPNVKAINLARNNLGSLPAQVFENNQEVQFLLLSGNNLDQVRPDLISSMEDLRQIWLNDNNLRNIPNNFFANNQLIKFIWMANNRFNKVESSLFADKNNLVKVSMDGYYNNCEVEQCYERQNQNCQCTNN